MKGIKKLLAVVLIITFVMLPLASVQAEGGTGIQGLVAHYKFDGNFTDASGNGNDGTLIGNVSFVDSVNGKGARFEGGHVEVEHKDILNLENGFTFSVWIYKEHGREQLHQPIIAKSGAEKRPSQPAYYFLNYQDKPEVSSVENKAQSNYWIDIQKWSLCTVTADGQSVKFYIDGVLTETVNKKFVFHKSTGKLYIGYKDDGSQGLRIFKGIMDDLKIYNYAMTEAEVKNEYSAVANGSGKYLVNRPLGLVGFYRFEDSLNGLGSLEDASGYRNNGTGIGAVGGLTYTNGAAGRALVCDGASYIEVNDSDSLDMDKGFTCSVWLNTDDHKKTGVNYQPIVDKRDGNTFLWKDRSAYFLEVGFADKTNLDLHKAGLNAGSGESGKFLVPRPVNKWYMLTVTANGQDMKLYIDGVLKQTIAKQNSIPHSMGKLMIGFKSNVNKQTTFFKGMMDELRLYNYELSAAEVQGLYGLRDKLNVTAGKTTLTKGEKTQLATILKSYKFTSPAAEPNTGTHVIVVQKGTDAFVDTNITATAKYASSNTKVLTVSAGGAVTAVGKGTATVTISNEFGVVSTVAFTVQ